MVIEIPEGEFRCRIVEPRKPAVVLFYMQRCPYCQAFMPTFHELSKRMRATAAQVDISDYDSDLWEEYGIAAVPTIISFRNGKICTRVDAVLHQGLNRSSLEREMLAKTQCFMA